MPCCCLSFTHASARQLRRDHVNPPPRRCTGGCCCSRRHGHVHLCRVLAVQVRAQHRLREQPQLPPQLHRLHRLLRRHLQQLHRRRRRRGRPGCPLGRVRPVPVPRRPEPRRLRVVRAGDGGAARRRVRQLVRRVAAGRRLLRAVRRQRLRRPGRHHRRVPQVQLQHERRRHVPEEPRRRPQAAAGRVRVQAEHLRHGTGGGAVPRRHCGGRLRRLPGAGGGGAQGHVRLGAGRRRVPGAVLREVLGKWPRFPLFTRLFGRRIWEDCGNNNRYIGWASTPRGVHLFPHESMLATGSFCPCTAFDWRTWPNKNHLKRAFVEDVRKPRGDACMLKPHSCFKPNSERHPHEVGAPWSL